MGQPHLRRSIHNDIAALTNHRKSKASTTESLPTKDGNLYIEDANQVETPILKETLSTVNPSRLAY